MALDSAHPKMPVQGSAPPNPDQIAKTPLRGRLPDQTPVDTLATAAEFLGDTTNAVNRRPFLIAGQEQRDNAFVLRMATDEFFERKDHAGDTRLHVGRSAAVQHALAHFRLERRTRPFVGRSARNDIGVPQKNQHGSAAAMRSPQVAHVAIVQILDGEARLAQSLTDEGLATGIFGGDRSTPDQFAREIENCGLMIG
jgi:hypothetical protein